MGIEVLVPDVNRSLAEFAADFSGGQGVVGAKGGSPGAITFGLAAVRNVGEGLVALIVDEREQQRALRRLLRLLPAGRSPGPQQADHRVADQGRRLRLARPSPPGPVPGRSRRSSTGPSSAGGSTMPGSSPCSPPSRPKPTVRPPASPTPGCPSPTPSSTSPSGWPSRRRCSGLYISDHPLMGLEGSLARLTDCTLAELRDADPDGGAGSGGGSGYGGEGQVRDGRRRDHRAGPPVHQKGRPDGHLRAGGPQRLHRGVRVPEGHGRLRRPARRRRHRGASRAGWTCGTTGSSWCAWRSSDPSWPPTASTDLRISLPLNTLTDRTVDGLKHLLAEHPGDSPVFLHVGEKVLRLPSGVQRGQPSGPDRRAAGAARAQRHPGPEAVASRPRPSDLRWRSGPVGVSRSEGPDTTGGSKIP